MVTTPPAKAAPFKKKAIPQAVRRGVALKYGCEPGGGAIAGCYICGHRGYIVWTRLRSGRPSFWVRFDGLELDHVIPESKGGPTSVANIALACRPCNRRKGAKI